MFCFVFFLPILLLFRSWNSSVVKPLSFPRVKFWNQCCVLVFFFWMLLLMKIKMWGWCEQLGTLWDLSESGVMRRLLATWRWGERRLCSFLRAVWRLRSMSFWGGTSVILAALDSVSRSTLTLASSKFFLVPLSIFMYCNWFFYVDNAFWIPVLI